MPVPAYMKITGTNQGDITTGASTADSIGNIFKEGHSDEILVQAFEHVVTIPTDPQSGQPSGQRVHKAVVVTKIFDKTSPQLYLALCSAEVLTKVEFKWYRTAMTGGMEHYFTTKLEDAVITNIKAYMPHCQDPTKSTFTHLEEISLQYRKITWTHEKCGVTGEDDWRRS